MTANPHQHPMCFGCGEDNPAGLHATFTIRDHEVFGTLVVTETMLGAPNRLHGGVSMAFFDEGLGQVAMSHGAETMTASLTVDFRSPAYVGAVLTLRAWLDRHDGRKWFMRGEIHDGDRLVAEAHGLWIEPRP